MHPARRHSDPRRERGGLLRAVRVNAVDPEHRVVDAAAHRVRAVARWKLYDTMRSERCISEGSRASDIRHADVVDHRSTSCPCWSAFVGALAMPLPASSSSWVTVSRTISSYAATSKLTRL